MMAAFEYARPASVAEALALLGDGAAPLAGGTDLLGLMKDRIVAPRRLVDLGGVAEMRSIEESEGGLVVGAAVTLEELAAHPAVGRAYPSLLHAVDGILSPQIRGAGTVGGDLCQRPRCWYFRNGFGLLGRQNGRSLVVEGDNRFHAILGNTGPAYFVSASSLAPALSALEASVIVAAPKGERRVAVAEFFRTPTAEGERECVLAEGEIVKAVAVPVSRGWRNATYEVRAHASLDWPLATASVAIDVDGARVRAARIVLGHVAPVPWRAPEAEVAIVGHAVDDATARKAGRAAVDHARPLSRNGYKVPLASVAVARALLRATGKEA